MARLALLLAFGAMAAAGLPSPGLYLAIGGGIGAIGCGWIGFSRRTAPGPSRLAAAAAITIGVAGLLLGAVRVAMVLIALARIDALVR
jgi:hypothetical protein